MDKSTIYQFSIIGIIYKRPSHDIAFGHVLALGLTTDALTVYNIFINKWFFLYRIFSSSTFLNIDIIPRIHFIFNKSLA